MKDSLFGDVTINVLREREDQFLFGDYSFSF